MGIRGVVEICGYGLMIGIELDCFCGELVGKVLVVGLLINVMVDKVICFLLLLIFSENEVRELVDCSIFFIKEFLVV